MESLPPVNGLLDLVDHGYGQIGTREIRFACFVIPGAMDDLIQAFWPSGGVGATFCEFGLGTSSNELIKVYAWRR